MAEPTIKLPPPFWHHLLRQNTAIFCPWAKAGSMLQKAERSVPRRTDEGTDRELRAKRA